MYQFVTRLSPVNPREFYTTMFKLEGLKGTKEINNALNAIDEGFLLNVCLNPSTNSLEIVYHPSETAINSISLPISFCVFGSILFFCRKEGMSKRNLVDGTILFSNVFI